MGINEQLEQHLRFVSVKRSELEIADTALARAKFDSFEPKLVHNKMEGVYKTNLEKVGEILMMELNLTDFFDLNDAQKIGKPVSDHFEMLMVLDGAQAKFAQSAKDQRRYISIYGVMFGTKNDDGTYDIAYAIHQLQFDIRNFANHGFDLEELVAKLVELVETYPKHQALLAFKQENIIKEISYV